MTSLTKEERAVLFFFVSVLVAGTGLSYAIKKYPQLKNAAQFIEANQPYRKVNINTASYDDLLSVPHIGHYTATKILEMRAQNGLFISLDQITTIKRIHQKNFDKFSKYLCVK